MMDQDNLGLILLYLIVLGVLSFLSIRFREKFWNRFGLVFFPILLAGLFLYNLISFSATNQPYFNWAYRGQLQRLPSNELIDLYETSATPLRADWIYSIIEDNYQGAILLVPESEVDALDLSLEWLQTQGRLAGVEIIEDDHQLTEEEVEWILSWDYVDVLTQEVDQNNNITAEEGDNYIFITEDINGQYPLVLLRYENQVFFIPENLLLEIEEDL